MSAPPYQKLFWGSYHKHTAHLSHAREHGAYLLLIGALWNNEGRLPADDDTLAAYARLTTKEWLAIKPKLMPLFRVVRGKLTQARVTEDLAKYRDTSGKRKEAGKAGGLASGGKRAANREANASTLPTKPEPEPEPQEEEAIASVAGGDARQAFDEWNLLAVRIGLPVAKDLTDQRRKALKARLASGGMAAWREALAALEASPMCRGDNDRNWRADLDFVCQAKSFQRLREGFYGTGATDTAPAAQAPAVFDGPPELRAQVVAEHGEQFARAWIDSCRWFQADRTLIARNAFAKSRIERDLSSWLARCRVKVATATANTNDQHHHGAAA